MISVGIDVAKDKRGRFIISSGGEVLADVFTIPNDMAHAAKKLVRLIYALEKSRHPYRLPA